MRALKTSHVLLAMMLLGTCIGMAAAAADLRAQSSAVKSHEPPAVLFMCPHGAAKSVLAAAYFERLAKERGLHVRVDSAGTEPDPVVAPTIAAHLQRQGYSVPTANPRKATPQDVASSDVVVSLGCDLSGLPQPRGKLVRWDDVPPFSDDFTRADDAIRKRVSALVDELARAWKPKQ